LLTPGGTATRRVGKKQGSGHQKEQIERRGTSHRLPARAKAENAQRKKKVEDAAGNCKERFEQKGRTDASKKGQGYGGKKRGKSRIQNFNDEPGTSKKENVDGWETLFSERHVRKGSTEIRSVRLLPSLKRQRTPNQKQGRDISV